MEACRDIIPWDRADRLNPLEAMIVLRFTIKTAIDYAFAQRPVFYCCSNNSQQTVTVGAG